MKKTKNKRPIVVKDKIIEKLGKIDIAYGTELFPYEMYIAFGTSELSYTYGALGIKLNFVSEIIDLKGDKYLSMNLNMWGFCPPGSDGSYMPFNGWYYRPIMINKGTENKLYKLDYFKDGILCTSESRYSIIRDKDGYIEKLTGHEMIKIEDGFIPDNVYLTKIEVTYGQQGATWTEFDIKQYVIDKLNEHWVHYTECSSTTFFNFQCSRVDISPFTGDVVKGFKYPELLQVVNKRIEEFCHGLLTIKNTEDNNGKD